MNAGLVHTREYDKDTAELLTDDEVAAMEFAIAGDPEAHPIISGTGGVRKARWSRSGSGKSGGVRVAYYYVGHRGIIYMLLVFRKSEKSNLSKAERNALYKLTKVLKDEK